MRRREPIVLMRGATSLVATALVGGIGGGGALLAAGTGAESPQPRVAAAASNPRFEWLRRRVGTWDATMTMRPSADAEAIVVTGLIAERTAIGPYLQEVMKPAPGSSVEAFQRIDYLTYNTLQARWQYLSMDTRATVGLMYAQGTGADAEPDITVYFSDAPGPAELGPAVAGRFMRARHVLTRMSDDREVVRQYWTFPGSPEWLAVEYSYARRRAVP